MNDRNATATDGTGRTHEAQHEPVVATVGSSRIVRLLVAPKTRVLNPVIRRWPADAASVSPGWCSTSADGRAAGTPPRSGPACTATGS